MSTELSDYAIFIILRELRPASLIKLNFRRAIDRETHKEYCLEHEMSRVNLYFTVNIQRGRSHKNYLKLTEI